MTRIIEDKKKIIIIGVSGALFIILQFYLLDFWENQKLMEHAEVFQKGYDSGLENAVFTIYNNTEDCNITKIWVGNLSRYILDFNCPIDKIQETTP